MSIIEIIASTLEYGPILAADADMGVVITGNGAYLNLWVEGRAGGLVNTDCRARSADMWETSAADMWDEAKAWLAEILRGEVDD